MLIADAEMAGWGVAAIAILGAVGLLVERFYKARATSAVTVTEAERKARREDDAARTREENAMLKEYKQWAATQRQERAEDRELIHGLRNDVQTLSVRVARCEVERAALLERVANLEEGRRPDGGSKPHTPLPAPPEGEGLE